MANRHIKFFGAVIGLTSILILPGSAGVVFADELASRRVVVTEVAGDASFQVSGDSQWKTLQVGVILSESDRIRTGANGAVSLIAEGRSDASIAVKPNSEVELSTIAGGDATDKTLIDLQIGSVLVKAEKLNGASQFQVRTPSSIVGIRGTEFEVSVE